MSFNVSYTALNKAEALDKANHDQVMGNTPAGIRAFVVGAIEAVSDENLKGKALHVSVSGHLHGGSASVINPESNVAVRVHLVEVV